MAPSRMLVLQDQGWLPVWRTVLLCTSPGYVRRREIGKKENLSPMNVTIDWRNQGREVIRNWYKIHLNVNLLMHDNWVAYFRTWSRRSLFSGRAPTCRNQSNVLKFTKAIARHTKSRDQNPSLGYICPGEPHERSPNAPKFEDRSQETRARCPRSSVEAGQKCFKIKGASKSNILLTFGK